MKSIVALSVAAAAVNAEVFFREEFDKGWEDRWVVSKWKDAQMGDFDTAVGSNSIDDSDKGLKTTQDARFYGISAEFPEFSSEDKDLYIQYQVKYESDVECGGSYIKLGPKMEDQTKFGDPTPYYIMFGPDKCGSSSRTHLIFSYKGENYLKKSDMPYKQMSDYGLPALYTLKVGKDNKVDVWWNEDHLVKAADLQEGWKMLGEKEILDPEDTKPSDWVDEPMMEDPEDSKPDDWVEDKEIVDPDATQPEDWDADEDGEWEPPMKANPDYKGEWKPKKISNPDYKGPWEQKKIPNPDFEENDKLHAYKAFGFVGIDIWQVKAKTIFDKFLITDDEAEMVKGKEAFKELYDAEKAKKKEKDEAAKAAAPKKEETPEPDDDDDDDVDDTDDDKDDEDL